MGKQAFRSMNMRVALESIENGWMDGVGGWVKVAAEAGKIASKQTGARSNRDGRR